MNHLTDEQLEQALAAGAPFRDHLDACPACRRRLEEHRAVRDRLRTAFASVTAGEDFRARLQHQLASALPEHGQPSQARAPRRASRGLRFRLWPAVAAAAMLIVAVPVVFYLSEPRTAAAADQLAAIHARNLDPEMPLIAPSDPVGMKAFFRKRLGYLPALPESVTDVSIRGCCLCHFRDRAAGTYVVRTGAGPVSIVVLTDALESLGMATSRSKAGDRIARGAKGKCNVVARRIGEYTYCAVGEAPHDVLDELLHKLATPASPQP